MFRPFRQSLIIWVCVALLAGLFVHSALTAGQTWDDQINLEGLKAQLEFASHVFIDKSGGIANKNFRDLPGDLEYYGIGVLFPAYAAASLVDIVLLGESETSPETIFFFLQLLAFACALVAALYTGKLVWFATDRREIGVLATAALLVIPVWVGYSFFDYKDLSVAAGLIATVYYAARAYEEPRPAWGALFFIALLFLGAQKIAALPLALPACMAVALAVVRYRSIRLVVLFAALSVGFLAALYVITPPSWYEPLAFVQSSLEYMSHHAWGGCTLTAGECIGRNYNDGEGYTAAKYLGLWYAVQLPILLLAGLIAAAIFYLRDLHQSNAAKHLIFASLLWPIITIIAANSTLYDGIRHTLFLIPLAVSFVFVSIPEGFFHRWRPALIAYGIFLLIDAVALQPYQYVWFNEPARFYANETNFETDFWGFSLREAADLGNSLQRPKEWIVGNPAHLVGPYVKKRYKGEIKEIPETSGDTYLFVSFTREGLQPAKACKIIGNVTRRMFFSPHLLNLAFVARCPLNSEDRSRHSGTR